MSYFSLSLVFSHSGYTEQESLKIDPGLSATETILDTPSAIIEFSPLETGLRVQLNGIQPDEIQDISINQQSIYGYTKEGVNNGHVIFETDGISTTLDYDLSDRNFFEDGDSPLLGIVLKSGDVLYKNVIVSGGQAKCPICPISVPLLIVSAVLT